MGKTYTQITYSGNLIRNSVFFFINSSKLESEQDQSDLNHPALSVLQIAQAISLDKRDN